MGVLPVPLALPGRCVWKVFQIEVPAALALLVPVDKLPDGPLQRRLLVSLLYPIRRRESSTNLPGEGNFCAAARSLSQKKFRPISFHKGRFYDTIKAE